MKKWEINGVRLVIFPKKIKKSLWFQNYDIWLYHLPSHNYVIISFSKEIMFWNYYPPTFLHNVIKYSVFFDGFPKLSRPNLRPFWTPVNFLKLMKPDLWIFFESSFWTVWWCSFLVYMPFSWRNSFVNKWYLVGV